MSTKTKGHSQRPATSESGDPVPPGEPLYRFRVVLLRPLYPGNVGSVARVMKNLGFRRLSIVADRDPREAPEAAWMAHGARDVLEAATVHGELRSALDPGALLVGASSRRGRRWREVLDPESLAELAAQQAPGREVTLLFGPEDRGLSVEEISLCRWVVRIPTHPDCPSMNLSHAVGLVCYVLNRAQREGRPPPRTSRLVPPRQRGRFLEELEGWLRETGFFEGDARTHAAMRRLHRLLDRAAPDKAEMGLLWAVLHHLEGRLK